MKKVLQRLLICYILIQPFMEIIYFYQGTLANIGPFTIPTLVRLVLVIALLLIFFLVHKFSKPSYHLAIYGFVVLIYLVAHLWLTKNALSSLTDGFTYSVTQEISYVLRVVFPTLILFISADTSLEKSTLERITWWLATAISGTIVVSNLAVFAIASYDKATMISANIFSWFDVVNRPDFMQLASDGFFLFANSISAIMILLLPIALHYYLRQSSWYKLIILIVMALSALMIGTRTAIFGSLAAFIVIPAFYFFADVPAEESLQWHVKVKKVIPLAAIILVLGLIYPFSPSTGRVSANNQVNIATADRSKASSKQLLQLREEMQQQPKQAKRLAQNYLDTHFDVRGTYGNVVSATNPIDKYPELWIDVLTWNAPDQVNFRKIEKANVDLLKQQIVPPVRLLFGISFVRLNFFIFNYERDFINQFYTLGVLGIVLFILPFVLLCLYLAGKFCFKKQNWTVENFAYLFSFALFFGAAYLTGNVLDSITAGSLVAFFMGQNYRNYRV